MKFALRLLCQQGRPVRHRLLFARPLIVEKIGNLPPQRGQDRGIERENPVQRRLVREPRGRKRIARQQTGSGGGRDIEHAIANGDAEAGRSTPAAEYAEWQVLNGKFTTIAIGGFHPALAAGRVGFVERLQAAPPVHHF